MRNRVVLGFLLALFVVGGAWFWRRADPDVRLANGKVALREGEFEAAEWLAGKLEAEGHSDHALLLYGESALLQGKAEAALGLLDRIQDRDRLQLQALPLVGRAYLALGNVPEAQRTFSYLLERRPDDPDGYRGLAAAAFDLGSWPEAVEHSRKWADLVPGDGRPYRLMGLMHKDLGRFPHAIEAYRTALAKDLNASVRQEVREELSECYLKRNEFRQAFEQLDASPAEYRRRGRFLVLWGDCLRALGKTEEAGQAADAALAATPEDPAALRLKGRLLLEADRVAEALPYLQKAAKIPPLNFENHHLLGQAYARLGRAEDAKKEQVQVQVIQETMDTLTKLTDALLSNPRSSDLHSKLAVNFDRMEMKELAAKHRHLAAITKVR